MLALYAGLCGDVRSIVDGMVLHDRHLTARLLLRRIGAHLRRLYDAVAPWDQGDGMAAEDCELLGRDGNVYKGQPQADDVAGALRSALAGAVRPTPPATPSAGGAPPRPVYAFREASQTR